MGLLGPTRSMTSFLAILTRETGVEGMLLGAGAGVDGADQARLERLGTGDVLYEAGELRKLGTGDRGGE